MSKKTAAAKAKLQKSTVGFRHERADWTAFRTVDGLTRRAGVPPELLRRLVLKEAADNGLDNNVETRVGRTREGGYFIEDDGPGIDGSPEEIAYLFSMSRPLVSTKLRLPIRGALGNGLRVLAGGVFASEGSLAVITHDRRIELRPEFDGNTKVVSSKKSITRSAPGSKSNSARNCLTILTRCNGPRSLSIWLQADQATPARHHLGGTTPRASANCWMPVAIS